LHRPVDVEVLRGGRGEAETDHSNVAAPPSEPREIASRPENRGSGPGYLLGSSDHLYGVAVERRQQPSTSCGKRLRCKGISERVATKRLLVFSLAVGLIGGPLLLASGAEEGEVLAFDDLDGKRQPHHRELPGEHINALLVEQPRRGQNRQGAV